MRKVTPKYIAKSANMRLCYGLVVVLIFDMFSCASRPAWLGNEMKGPPDAGVVRRGKEGPRHDSEQLIWSDFTVHYSHAILHDSRRV